MRPPPPSRNARPVARTLPDLVAIGAVSMEHAKLRANDGALIMVQRRLTLAAWFATAHERLTRRRQVNERHAALPRKPPFERAHDKGHIRARRPQAVALLLRVVHAEIHEAEAAGATLVCCLDTRKVPGPPAADGSDLANAEPGRGAGRGFGRVSRSTGGT